MILSNPTKTNPLAINELEVPEFHGDVFCTWQIKLWCQDCRSLRITLNSRLAIAAAAIVQRIIIRRRPRVLRPVSPFRKSSNPAATIVDAVGEFDGCRQGRSQKSERTDRVCGLKLSFPRRPPSSKSSPLPTTLTCLSWGYLHHHTYCYVCAV